MASALLLVAALVPACSDVEDAAAPTFTPVTAGVLTVATALPAPGFWDGDTPETLTGGFEWGLAAELAERLDMRLVVVDVPFERLDRGDLGGADVAIAQISITDERADRLQFSVPYHAVDAGVLARAGTEVPDLREARDLRWAAVEGSTDADLLDEVVRPDEDVLLVADEVSAAAAVAAGEVDAALIDAPTAMVLAGQVDGLEAVARFETDEDYGVALPHDAGAEDREAVDVALRAIEADGTLDDLEARWLTPVLRDDPDDLPVIRTR